MPRCRSCSEAWTWHDELSPLFFRDAHTCPRCGRVSHRPRVVRVLYVGVAMALAYTLPGWHLRLAVVLAMLPGLMAMQLLAKPRDEAPRPSRTEADEAS